MKDHTVVAAGASSGGDPMAAFDGNVNGNWQSAASDPEYIMADLGSLQAFNRLVFNWEGASAGRKGSDAFFLPRISSASLE